MNTVDYVMVRIYDRYSRSCYHRIFMFEDMPQDVKDFLSNRKASWVYDGAADEFCLLLEAGHSCMLDYDNVVELMHLNDRYDKELFVFTSSEEGNQHMYEHILSNFEMHQMLKGCAS